MNTELDKTTSHGTNMEKAWLYLAVLVIVLTAASNFLCISKLPFPLGWDETRYLTRVLKDSFIFKDDGVVGIARAIMDQDRARPPAHRMQAFPFVMAFGFSPRILRAVTYTFFLLSGYFVFLTTKKLASKSAAAFTVMFFMLSPQCIDSCRRFFMESNLYLAISLMLYFVSGAILNHKYSSKQWLGLGAAIGLGCWAKTSFLLVAGPSLFILFLLLLWQPGRRESVTFLVKGVLTGVLIALPWWYRNFEPAFAFSQYASSFSNHSLSIVQWGHLFSIKVFGASSMCLVVVLLLGMLLGGRKPADSNKKELRVLTVFCLMCSAPLIVAQLVGSNQNVRLISPAFVTIVILLGICFFKSRFANTKVFFVIAAVLFSLQLVLNVTGVYEQKSFLEQADWQKLRALCLEHGITNPEIAILGKSRVFHSAQISYPWRLNNEQISVSNMWPQTQDFDWEEIDEIAKSKDVVVTVYNMSPFGRTYFVNAAIDSKNRYNNELFERYSNDAAFCPPVSLKIGRITPLDVKVFIRNKF